jgi:hypothetical protein
LRIDGANFSRHTVGAEPAAVGIGRVNSTLMTIVTSAVQVELFNLSEPVALDGYRAVATVFDDTAAKFAACAAKSDPEANSEAMVGQSGPARTAWIDAVGHARRLDDLVVLLVAAAELAGIVVDRDEELIR